MRYSAFTPKYVERACGTCKGKQVGRDRDTGKIVKCPKCVGTGTAFQRLTMHTLPGRNRREKRRRLSQAYRAYLRQKWAAEAAA